MHDTETCLRRPTGAWLGVLLMATACNGEPDESDLFGDGNGEPGDGGSGDGAPGDDGGSGDDGGPGDDGGGGSDDGGGGDDGGVRFDTPDGEGGPGDGTKGCEKVDFLFVIDNSGSMGDNQANLANSFPGFIAAIQSELDADDYHIMVVDSDEDGSFLQCNGQTCGADFPRPGCCPPVNGCDDRMGAGQIAGAGGNCGIAGGKRYMIGTQPDLPGTFGCAARVGTGGFANEMPLTAMRHALSDELNGAGACNDGFLRDDAILVVTLVSDATTTTANIEHGGGDPAMWHDVVVDAKGGNEAAIVAIGLFGDNDVAGGVCGPDANGSHGSLYRDFITGFGGQGFLGSVCLPDYSPLFLEAVSTIDLTCDEFVPEG